MYLQAIAITVYEVHAGPVAPQTLYKSLTECEKANEDTFFWAIYFMKNFTKNYNLLSPWIFFLFSSISSS